jgi:acetamidase/formamidase
MRQFFLFLCLLTASWSQNTSSTPAGKWISNLKFFDNNNYDRMELALSGDKITGKLGNNTLNGEFHSGQIEATVNDPQGNIKLSGHLDGDRIQGAATFERDKVELKWEAQREVPRAAAPKTHTFEPTQFQHYFSSAIEPVLRLNPGDTVATWSVDAGGTDPKGVRRTSGGNPLTGPFYIEGAVPGDTLIVRFNRIRLNRDTAISSPLIVNGALDASYVERRKNVEGYSADWKLDRNAGFASLQKPTGSMKDYRVPLAPMLGCVGVAPPGGNQYRSGFLGSYGGNMDYNQVREGITIYLPVYVPGALLFVGDGHALQGAGELTGNALETSMDIEFTVSLEPGGSPPAPRMENDQYLMASGIAGSMDEAFRNATTNLVRWLEKKYSLNAAEVSSVLGTAMVYDVAEVVDPADHVVAKVPKSVLAALKAK